ncbi:MAG: YceI family protein [Acidobacteriota bacterium]
MKIIHLLVVLALAFSPSLAAGEVELDPAESVLAVITHKAGIAAKKAHNHLIAAPVSEAKLSFDPAEPMNASFRLDFAAEQLAVDPWDLEQTWYPRLETLGILDEPFTEIADKDRQKIRKSMLSDDQLDAAKFPRISAEVTRLEEGASTHGGVEFPYSAKLRFNVHGQNVEKTVAARYELEGAILKVEALGTFQFTEFGIEPFSAFFGAVKNEDGFHLYLNLAGTVAP